MGAAQGTVSYRLYRVEGGLPEDVLGTFHPAIQRHAFEALTPDAEEDSRTGWCVLGRLFDTELSPEQVFRQEYLSLSMRSDRWALPSLLLKATLEERAEAYAREHGLLRLGRAQRELLREEVVREMKGQTLPAANLVDMVWNLDTGRLRFWSSSGRVNELFMELFEATFGLRLVPNSAYVAALNAPLSEDAVAALDGLEQESFGRWERG